MCKLSNKCNENFGSVSRMASRLARTSNEWVSSRSPKPLPRPLDSTEPPSPPPIPKKPLTCYNGDLTRPTTVLHTATRYSTASPLFRTAVDFFPFYPRVSTNTDHERLFVDRKLHTKITDNIAGLGAETTRNTTQQTNKQTNKQTQATRFRPDGFVGFDPTVKDTPGDGDDCQGGLIPSPPPTSHPHALTPSYKPGTPSPAQPYCHRGGGRELVPAAAAADHDYPTHRFENEQARHGESGGRVNQKNHHHLDLEEGGSVNQKKTSSP